MTGFARKRLLHLTDRLSQRGGADWHLLGVLEALACDAEVVLAVGRDDGTVRAPCRTVQLSGLDSLERAGIADLDRLEAEVAPDVVHVHNVMNPDVLEWAAARGAVMTVQDHRSFCPGSGKLLLAGGPCREAMSRDQCAACFEDERYFERVLARTEERLAAVRNMRQLTVLSSYMRGELIGVGVEADRIHVIPPFVHGLDQDAAPDGEPCVLFAGRLVASKGADAAVDAWRRSGVELPLVVAGTGSQRARLEAAGVDVLGWVPHERLSGLYRRARAVVLPSRWQEPFGIVGLEALTLGVPVVAWDSGGVRDWHPGPGLVPWGDVDALASALRAVVNEPAARVAPRRPFGREQLMAQLWGVYQG